MFEIAPTDLPFDEAIAFFQQKGIAVSPNSWRDLWQEMHARAFTVARVTKMDILTDIRAEVQKALDKGISLGEFKKNLIPMLQRKGWMTPPGELPQVVLPDGTVRKRLTPWRLENIYRTNLQSAYSVGRYTQMMEVADQRPYWQYRAILDSKTRPAHAAMNGKVYDCRHPVWSQWYPPNGFNCRCYVKSLSGDDVKARKLKVETSGTDMLPDEGWRYNVGKAGVDGIDDSRFSQNVILGLGVIEAFGEKTFVDYGRPKLKDVPDSLRLDNPVRVQTIAERVSMGLSEAEAMSQVEQTYRVMMGIEPGAEGAWIRDYEGMGVRVNMGVLDYILSKGEGREAFLGYIRPTLEKPFEVWFVEDAASGKIRKRYIAVFEKNFLVVVDRYRDGWGIWDAYPISRASAADKQRKGWLAFPVNAQ